MDKLDKLKKHGKLGERDPWKNWTLEEKKSLLDIYLKLCKKEKHIFDLIYRYQGCDSWEDIFRDYDCKYLEDKAGGVEMAINQMIVIDEIFENIEEEELKKWKKN